MRIIVNSEEFSWDVQPLVDQAKMKILALPSLTLAYCKRETNKVADWLAKAHRMNFLPTNWVSQPLFALLDLLCADSLNVFTKHSAN